MCTSEQGLDKNFPCYGVYLSLVINQSVESLRLRKPCLLNLNFSPLLTYVLSITLIALHTTCFNPLPI